MKSRRYRKSQSQDRSAESSLREPFLLLNPLQEAKNQHNRVCRVITTPIERLKILQQSHSVESAAQPSLVSLLRTHSLRSLYRGFTPTLLRDTAYGPYFLMYEYISRGGSFGLFDSPTTRHQKMRGDLREEVDSELWGDSDSSPTSTTRILVAGGMAGIVGWGIT